jgi:ParB family chromosome partitioning protein
MPRKAKGFFGQAVRPEDELARQRDVEALIVPRRLMAQDLPIARVRPNPFQPRRTFDGLEELAQAIRAQGFTTRLRVRPDPSEPGYFQLVFGERRLRAAQAAGLTEVPAEVAEHTDDELLEIGLAENIQRRDLDPLEEAQAFHLMIEQRGYSIRRLAERIGKDKSYVENRLALLRSPDDVQEMVAERPDTLRVAREIAKLPTPEAREPLIEAVVGAAVSTQDVRAIVSETVGLDPGAIAGRVAERVADRAGDRGRSSDGIQRRPAPNVHRAMERDVHALETVLDRLRQLLPSLDAADRAALVEHLGRLEAEIDTIVTDLGQPAAV